MAEMCLIQTLSTEYLSGIEFNKKARSSDSMEWICSTDQQKYMYCAFLLYTNIQDEWFSRNTYLLFMPSCQVFRTTIGGYKLNSVNNRKDYEGNIGASSYNKYTTTERAQHIVVEYNMTSCTRYTYQHQHSMGH